MSGFETDYRLPRILSKSDDPPNHRLLLEILPELDCFEGHFPGNPVLPGVVQLHWAIIISLSLFGFRDAPLEIKQLKFKNAVIPPATLELTLCKLTEHEVRFEYASPGQQHSQGQLIFIQTSPC